jgi:two-component system sensor kinase FixL
LSTSKARIVLVNSQTEKLFGYARQELLGNSADMLVPERYRDAHPNNGSGYYTRPPLTPRAAKREMIGRRKDGSEFPIEVSLNPLESDEGLFFTSAIRDISARKQVEETLVRHTAELARSEEAYREQSKILRSILDSISDAVIVTNDKGRFLLINPAAEQVLGRSQSEAVTGTWTKRSGLFLPDKKTPVPVEEMPLVRAIRGQAVDGAEMFVCHPRQPAGMWVSANARPLRDDAGNIRGGVVVFRDITERKEAEAALQQRTALLALLHDVAVAANEATVLVEAMQSCLDHVCSHIGWPVGHAYLLAEDDAGDPRAVHLWYLAEPARFTAFRQATEADPRSAEEGWPGMVLAGGQAVWVGDVSGDPYFVRAEPARAAGIRAGFAFPVLLRKSVVGVLEFFTTEPVEPNPALLQAMVSVGTQLGRVIERQRAQQSLREGQELSRSIIETANEAFVAMDAEGKIIDWNRQAESTFGWSHAEAVGQPLAGLIIPPDYRDAHAKGLRHFLATGEGPVLNRRIEVQALHRSGRLFPVELTIAPLRARQGYRFNAFVHDITDRKEAEEKLRGFAGQLARSNRELQDFASVASHDLQEPLRKVQAFGDMLESRCAARLDAPGRDYLHRMLGAAHRMQTLINDLLLYSRVTSKAHPFSPVKLGQVAQEVVSDLEARIQQTGGRVEVGELPVIDADPLQMRQLLQNLIGNGLKFHRPGVPPVIRVSAELVPGAGRSAGNGAPAKVCQLRVEDNGIGFDEKYRDRLFQVFQRLHARGEYEGTGMGLAICRRIAERHGGSISAHSVPGQGATFVVALPVSQVRQEDRP